MDRKVKFFSGGLKKLGVGAVAAAFAATFTLIGKVEKRGQARLCGVPPLRLSQSPFFLRDFIGYFVFVVAVVVEIVVGVWSFILFTSNLAKFGVVTTLYFLVVPITSMASIPLPGSKNKPSSPRTLRAVAHASAWMAVGATTVTEAAAWAGRAVRGSTMWLNRCSPIVRYRR